MNEFRPKFRFSLETRFLQILWLTCGNVTNRKPRRILSNTFAEALRIIKAKNE
ncbi:MAG: hypothetical protein MGU50_23295 [Trichodesmium sp. MAG_R02]|nr:hypothetical protein [Trichodesmium sp. MAG_R02]